MRTFIELLQQINFET